MSLLPYCFHHTKPKDEVKSCNKEHTLPIVVIGDFIRTFEFAPSVPQLPIVQPNGNIPFPVSVTTPRHVRYVEIPDTGVIVPRGLYKIRWLLNPSDDAEVSLLVNNKAPLASNGFSYGKQIKTAGSPWLEAEYTVRADLHSNFIALKNTGTTLFTLSDIPNTRQGDIAILTQFTIERITDDL